MNLFYDIKIFLMANKFDIYPKHN